MGTGGPFPGVKRYWGVTLTTHPHLVPGSRTSRSCTSSLPWPLNDAAGRLYFHFTYLSWNVFFRIQHLLISGTLYKTQQSARKAVSETSLPKSNNSCSLFVLLYMGEWRECIWISHCRYLHRMIILYWTVFLRLELLKCSFPEYLLVLRVCAFSQMYAQVTSWSTCCLPFTVYCNDSPLHCEFIWNVLSVVTPPFTEVSSYSWLCEVLVANCSQICFVLTSC
jgi:hypothetical protein